MQTRRNAEDSCRKLFKDSCRKLSKDSCRKLFNNTGGETTKMQIRRNAKDSCGELFRDHESTANDGDRLRRLQLHCDYWDRLRRRRCDTNRGCQFSGGIRALDPDPSVQKEEGQSAAGRIRQGFRRDPNPSTHGRFVQESLCGFRCRRKCVPG